MRVKFIYNDANERYDAYDGDRHIGYISVVRRLLDVDGFAANLRLPYAAVLIQDLTCSFEMSGFERVMREFVKRYLQNVIKVEGLQPGRITYNVDVEGVFCDD